MFIALSERDDGLGLLDNRCKLDSQLFRLRCLAVPLSSHDLDLTRSHALSSSRDEASTASSTQRPTAPAVAELPKVLDQATSHNRRSLPAIGYTPAASSLPRVAVSRDVACSRAASSLSWTSAIGLSEGIRCTLTHPVFTQNCVMPDRSSCQADVDDEVSLYPGRGAFSQGLAPDEEGLCRSLWCLPRCI